MGIATQHSATTVLYGVSDARTCLQPHSLHAFHHYPTSLALPSQQVTPPLYLLTPSILPSPYLDPDSEIPHYLEHCIYIEDTISQRKTAALSQLRLSLRGGGSDGVTVS